MIKIFRGGRGGDTSKPPPPYEQLLPLPTPCFKMFLERSPTTPLQASFTATPSPSTIPSPLKILIIHPLRVNWRIPYILTGFGVLESLYFGWGRRSSYVRKQHISRCTMVVFFRHKLFVIFVKIGPVISPSKNFLVKKLSACFCRVN